METKPTCDTCGTPLSNGLCPRCLLDVGQATRLSDSQSSTPTIADPSSLDARPSTRSFGEYELLEEIARGGMGIVYKARQKNLNRTVAVKMIIGGQFASKQIAQRFKAEAIAAAVLQHPHIVSVHEVGVHDGQHFFSMDFVEGQNLSQLVGNRPLPARTAARYVKQIAEAIHYAHQQGILHRDLKPSNVLIDAASDQPRVTDFGLAKRLTTDSSLDPGHSTLTLTGQVLGSPNFMPPEQASGERSKVGRPSDVYGLGGILYFLLTARAPFQGETIGATIHQAIHMEPIAPRLLNASLPRDLETICLKCLEKEPAKRYATAQELANELDRFLKDEPILARPVNAPEKVWRWCRRKPALAASFLATLFLLLVVVIGSPIAIFRVNQARNEAVAERQRAEAETLRAQRSEYASDMLVAFQALEKSNSGRVRNLLEKHRPLAQGITNKEQQSVNRPFAQGLTRDLRFQTPDFRDWEWRYLWNQTRGEELLTLATYTNGFGAIAWSSDGARIASSRMEGEIEILDAASGARLRHFEQTNYVWLLRFLDADNLLVARERPGVIQLWNTATGRTNDFHFPMQPELRAVALTADGQTFAAAGLDWVRLWDAHTGEEIASPPSGRGWHFNTRAIAFSPDGTRFAYSKISFKVEDASVVIWDIEKARPMTELKGGHVDLITSLAFSPDGRTLASGSYDKTVKLWDVESSQVRTNLVGHHGAVHALQFSPDGKVLATGCADQLLRLWDVDTGMELKRWQGHRNEVLRLACSPADDRIVTGSLDGTVRLWSRTLGEKAVVSRSSPSGIFSAWPTANSLWTFDSVTLNLWDTANFALAASFQPYSDPAVRRRVAFSADGQRTAMQLAGEHVGIYETKSFRRVQELRGFTRPITKLAFSRDGNILAVRRDDSSIRFWNWENATEVSTIELRPQGGQAICFSPDGQNAGVGYGDGVVEIWRFRERAKLASLKVHSLEPDAIFLLSDNRRMVTYGVEPWVLVSDWHTSETLAQLRGPHFNYTSVAISKDERRLAAGTVDGAITLWDLESYQEVGNLEGHTSAVLGLVFPEDGNTLFSASHDSIRVWRAAPFTEIDKHQNSKFSKP